MKLLSEAALFSMFVIPWLAGTVLAQGWLKIIAVVFFPYAWYLVAEKTMQAAGFI